MVMVEGQYTSTVYSLIKDARFSEAIACLEPILEVCSRAMYALVTSSSSICDMLLELSNALQALPTNRAVLSLLGHCYFHQGHFESACQVYETLVRHHGEFPEYRLHHAQALFRMGELVEASRVLEAVSGLTERVDHLKLAIAYALDQVQECKRQLRASDSDNEAGLQMEGCALYKEGLYKCGFSPRE
jgi:tetratricopeptide (TPR) repeat protein